MKKKGKLKVYKAAWDHKYDKLPVKVGPLLEAKIDIGWTNATLCYKHFANAFVVTEGKDSTDGDGLEVEVVADLGATVIVLLPLRDSKTLPLEVYPEFVEVADEAELVEITSAAWRESAEDAEYGKHLAQVDAVMETVEAALGLGAVFAVETRYLDPARKDREPEYAIVDGDGGLQKLLESHLGLKNGTDWYVDPESGDLVAKTHGSIYQIGDSWAEEAAQVTIREIVDDADKECVRDIAATEDADEVSSVAESMFMSCGKASSLAARVQHAVATLAA